MRKDDPTIEEIRIIRHKISQRFHNSPREIVEYYLRLQKKYQARLTVHPQETEESLKKAETT